MHKKYSSITFIVLLGFTQMYGSENAQNNASPVAQALTTASNPAAAAAALSINQKSRKQAPTIKIPSAPIRMSYRHLDGLPVLITLTPKGFEHRYSPSTARELEDHVFYYGKDHLSHIHYTQPQNTPSPKSKISRSETSVSLQIDQ